MPYTEPLKIGAVYQSNSMSHLRRRVTRLRDGIVEYTLSKHGRVTHPFCLLTDDMFRDFTAREIPPSEL